MNTKKGFIFFFLCLFTLTACTAYKGNTPVTRTYLIYMNGSDLESDYGSASSDIEEMLKANIDPSATVYIQTGGTEYWHNPLISNDFNERFEIKDHKLVKLQSSEAASMGSAKTLSDFITWGIKQHKSDETVLILWNHGGGAITGFGKDENFVKDTLLLSELSNALKTAAEQTNTKLSVIAFDACLMSSLENISLISPYCDYIVASEDLVPDFGFDYEWFFNRESSASKDAKSIALALGKTYYMKAVMNGALSNATISVIDTSKIYDVMKAFDDSLDEFEENISAVNADPYTVSNNLMKTITFGGQSDKEGYSNMVDLMSLMEKSSAKNSESFNTLKKAVDEAVIYNRNGYLNMYACGISIYYPKYISQNTEFDLRLYSRLNFSENYARIITAYAQTAAKKIPPENLARTEPLKVDGIEMNAQLVNETAFFRVYTAVKEEGDTIASYRIIENKLLKTEDVHAIYNSINTKYGKSEEKYQIVQPKLYSLLRK